MNSGEMNLVAARHSNRQDGPVAAHLQQKASKSARAKGASCRSQFSGSFLLRTVACPRFL